MVPLEDFQDGTFDKINNYFAYIMTTDASYETLEIFDSDGGFCNLSFEYEIDYSNLLVHLEMTNSISQHLCRFTADKYSIKFDENI